LPSIRLQYESTKTTCQHLPSLAEARDYRRPLEALIIISVLVPSYITVPVPYIPQTISLWELRKSLFPPPSFFLAGSQVRTDDSGIMPLDRVVPGVTIGLQENVRGGGFPISFSCIEGNLGFYRLFAPTLWHGVQYSRFSERREVGGGTEGIEGLKIQGLRDEGIWCGCVMPPTGGRSQKGW